MECALTCLKAAHSDATSAVAALVRATRQSRRRRLPDPKRLPRNCSKEQRSRGRRRGNRCLHRPCGSPRAAARGGSHVPSGRTGIGRPLAQNVFLRCAERAFGHRWGHLLVGVIGEHPADQFAFAAGDSRIIGEVGQVQPQFGFLTLRTVAREAVL